jgi:hypothetical protein
MYSLFYILPDDPLKAKLAGCFQHTGRDFIKDESVLIEIRPE